MNESRAIKRSARDIWCVLDGVTARRLERGRSEFLYSDQRLDGRRETLQIGFLCLHPVSGKAFKFLPNAIDLSPSVLAELYRWRCEVEKLFGSLKNSLGQEMARASSLVGKEMQAEFLAPTRILLLLYEQTLERNHGIGPQSEDQRRSERRHEIHQIILKDGQPVSTLLLKARRATQRSVESVRWLCASIRDRLPELAALQHLPIFYAT